MYLKCVNVFPILYIQPVKLFGGMCPYFTWTYRVMWCEDKAIWWVKIILLDWFWQNIWYEYYNCIPDTALTGEYSLLINNVLIFYLFIISMMFRMQFLPGTNSQSCVDDIHAAAGVLSSILSAILPWNADN